MKNQRFKGLTIAASLAAVVSPGLIAQGGELEDKLARLEQTVQTQQQELQQLREGKSAQWLDERRAEEVKALVREVLADADTRASLQGSGLGAGYKDGFFIASEDGKFSLKINGETQIRYIYNHAEERPAAEPDEDENGFQIRRARLAFSGNFLDKRFTFRFREAYNRSNGNLQYDDAWVAYEILEGLKLKGGQFKPLFLREENVSGFTQLAVERSYSADYFTIDYTQGVELTYEAEKWNAAIAAHDGSYGLNSEYNADGTQLGVNGRAELLLAGNFKQFRDFTSFSGDNFGLLLGAGAGYEWGEEGAGTNTPDLIKYTADVSAEFGGANLFLGFTGQHFSDNDSTTGLPTNLDNSDQFSFVVQGGIFVITDKLELFTRYEWTDFDGVYYRPNGPTSQGGSRNLDDEDELGILTVGGNYYIRRHNAKLTLDVLYAFDPVPVDNTGAGLLRSDDDGQVAVRAQAQFRF